MEKLTNVKALNYVIENTELPAEVKEKVVAIRDGFVKKAENKKPTKTQVENEGLKVAVLDFLKGVEGAKATDIAQAGIEGINSTQKAVAVAKLLIAEGKVEKVTDKKTVLYKAV